MKIRHPLTVFFLVFLTLGIYILVWFVKTADEMRAKGANIPTAWLMIVPIAGFYWHYKWSEGVARVTNNQFSAGPAFLVTLFLGPIGMAVIQSHFNRCETPQ